MDVWLGVNAIINVINLGLLGSLVFTFAKIYKNSKANFALGLIFFSSLLSINNIISVYAYFTMAELFSDALVPYLLIISISELVGLGIFLKIALG